MGSSKSRPNSLSQNNDLLKENSRLKQRILQLEELLSSQSHTRSSLFIDNSKKNFEKKLVEPPEKVAFISRLKESVFIMRDEIKGLKRENFDLKEEILKNIKGSKVNLWVWRVYRGCLAYRLGIEELWNVVNCEQKVRINCHDLYCGMKALGLDASEKTVLKVFLEISEGENEISQEEFIRKIKAMKPLLAFTFDQVSEPLEHFAVALASHNVSLEMLKPVICKQKDYSRKAFFEFLLTEFSGVGFGNLGIIRNGVFGDFYKLSCEEIWKMISGMLPKIIVFADSEEKIMHEKMQIFMKAERTSYLRNCERADKDFSGSISFKLLFKILENLNLDLSEDLRLYLKCVCYRNNNDVTLAVYSNLILLFS